MKERPITLISPPAKWMHEDIPYPPLGIAYLSAIGKQMGINIDVIDFQLPLSENKLKEKVGRQEPQLVGISSTLMQLPDSVAIARQIKSSNPQSLIVFGGAGPNCLSTKQFFDYAGESVDLVCQGEGEITWADILTRFLGSNNKSHELTKPAYLFDDVAGTVIFENGNLLQNSSRKQIEDLDSIPLPDLEGIEAGKYIEMWRKNGGMGSISIFPSRGCPYGCIFCDKTIFGRNFRHHSPARIADELERIATDYKPLDDIFLFDDNLSTKRDVMLAFCDELNSRGLQIPWSCQARVNTVDPELLKAMYTAGCREIYFGVEATTPKLLSYLGKNINIDQATQAIAWAREVGMKPGCFLIVGVPTETKSDIEATASFIRQAKPSYVGFSVLIPFPGTQLYTRTKSLINPDLETQFEKWDDTRSSIYLPGTFEVNPRLSIRYLERVFKDMLAQEKIDFNPSQFVINRYEDK